MGSLDSDLKRSGWLMHAWNDPCLSDQFCRFQNGKKFSHRQGASLWPRYLAARHRPQLLGRVEGLPRRLGFSTRLRYFLAGSIERRFLCCRRSSRSSRLLGRLLSAVLVLPLTRTGRRGPSLCPAPTRARIPDDYRRARTQDSDLHRSRAVATSTSPLGGYRRTTSRCSRAPVVNLCTKTPDVSRPVPSSNQSHR